MHKRISTVRWEVRPLSNAAGAGVLGVAIFFLEFRNLDSRETRTVGFFGGGLGIGVKASAGSGSWISFTAHRAFGFHDLDGAGGRITTASAGLAGGYGLTYISCWTGQGPLFNHVSLSGFEWGSGAAASVAHGVWKIL